MFVMNGKVQTTVITILLTIFITCNSQTANYSDYEPNTSYNSKFLTLKRIKTVVCFKNVLFLYVYFIT